MKQEKGGGKQGDHGFVGDKILRKRKWLTVLTARKVKQVKDQKEAMS